MAADDLDRQRLWSAREKATGEQRLHAERRTKAAALVAELMASGVGNRKAITLAAKQLQISEGTLRNLYYKVKDFSPDLWGPVLLDRRVREKRVTGRSAEISDDARQFFWAITCATKHRFSPNAMNGWKSPQKHMAGPYRLNVPCVVSWNVKLIRVLSLPPVKVKTP